MTYTGLIVSGIWRLREEFANALFAEPSAYVQSKMEEAGWRFEKSQVYDGDGQGWSSRCLLAFNPKGQLAFKADAEAPDQTIPGGEAEYHRAKRAAIRTISWLPKPRR